MSQMERFGIRCLHCKHIDDGLADRRFFWDRTLSWIPHTSLKFWWWGQFSKNYEQLIQIIDLHLSIDLNFSSTLQIFPCKWYLISDFHLNLESLIWFLEFSSKFDRHISSQSGYRGGI